MKKLKIIVSSSLILAMLAGFAGCSSLKPVATTNAAPAVTTSAKPVETTTEETSDEPVEETTKEVTEATTKAESVTTTKKPSSAPAERKTTVKDAYKRTFKVKKKSVTTRYPKITIKGLNTDKVNKEIENKMKSYAKSNKYKLSYSYYIGKTFVSIFITVQLDPVNKEFKNYYVYNVSRKNGKKMSRKDMLAAINMKSTIFNSKVKNGINKMWNDYKKDNSAEKKKMQANSTKVITLNGAMPFVNSKGKKCYLIRQIEVPGQMSHIDLYGTC